MAHFSVLVIGDRVYEKMAKYQQTDGENEHAKYSWYEIGGRWRGALRLKEGREEVIGAPYPEPQEKRLTEYLDETGFQGVLDRNLRNFSMPSPGFVDQARSGDVEWEYMNDVIRKEQHLGECWEMVMIPREERSLELILEYKTHIGIEAFLPPDYFVQMYGTRQNYILVKSFFWTHAVITDDGEWHELGSETLLHASLETRAQMEDWVFHFWDRFLRDLASDTLITVMDCRSGGREHEERR